jgi:hypothetical protein
VKCAVAPAFHQRIEGEKPHAADAGLVVEERLRPEWQAIGEGGAQRRPLVMVAGHHEHRHRQRCQDVPEQRIVLRRPAIGEIAGEGDRIERRGKLGEIRDDAARGPFGIKPHQRRFGFAGEDVEIGNMGDQHGKYLSKRR